MFLSQHYMRAVRASSCFVVAQRLSEHGQREGTYVYEPTNCPTRHVVLDLTLKFITADHHDDGQNRM
jgi:hypothetical protein